MSPLPCLRQKHYTVKRWTSRQLDVQAVRVTLAGNHPPVDAHCSYPSQLHCNPLQRPALHFVIRRCERSCARQFPAGHVVSLSWTPFLAFNFHADRRQEDGARRHVYEVVICRCFCSKQDARRWTEVEDSVAGDAMP